jgi:hypothetical protein
MTAWNLFIPLAFLIIMVSYLGYKTDCLEDRIKELEKEKKK